MKNIDFATFKPAALSIVSILFSLMAGSIILLAIGKDPLIYFGLLFMRGMGSSLALIESIIKMAPLLIIFRVYSPSPTAGAAQPTIPWLPGCSPVITRSRRGP